MQDYFLKGFVGTFPEVAIIKGVTVAKFIVAVNCGHVDKPKKIWVKCTAWRDLAESVMEKVFPGDLVAIDGRISDITAWVDPTNPKKAKGSLSVHVSGIAKSTTPGQFKDIRNGG